MNYIKIWIMAIYILLLGMIAYTCNSQTYCQSAYEETLQRVKIIQLERKLSLCNKYMDFSKQNIYLNYRIDSILNACNSNTERITKDLTFKFNTSLSTIDTISKQNKQIKTAYENDLNEWNRKESRLTKQINYHKKKAAIFSGIAFFLGSATMFLLQSH